MESKNHKVIKKFISSDEKTEIINWINSLSIENQVVTNNHIKEVRKELKGNSYMFDVSKTKETIEICKFQSSNNVINQEIPGVIYSVIERISQTIEIPQNRVFFQIIEMNSGGKVRPHYDATVDGCINYKCNISLKSENYDFYVDKDILNIDEEDLYCFEASLYKHWSEEFKFDRMLLSFGFILSYQDLGRDEEDPRVRLSKRILKYFQNL